MKQLELPDAAAQWADVLARLRGSVLSVPRMTAAGWRLVEVYAAHAPGVPRRDARAGLYRCQRMAREGAWIELWYTTGAATLPHDLVAATCGGVATVLGCEPDVVIRYVYTGRTA